MLADIVARCGIDQPALSRLENGHTPNPTLDTLWRYAAALGKRLVLMAEDVAEMRARGGRIVGLVLPHTGAEGLARQPPLSAGIDEWLRTAISLSSPTIFALLLASANQRRCHARLRRLPPPAWKARRMPKAWGRIICWK